MCHVIKTGKVSENPFLYKIFICFIIVDFPASSAPKLTENSIK